MCSVVQLAKRHVDIWLCSFDDMIQPDIIDNDVNFCDGVQESDVEQSHTICSLCVPLHDDSAYTFDSSIYTPVHMI